MTRQLPLLCIVAALLAAAVAYPRAALAHASLVEAAPAEGAVLAAPPNAFHLTFNEPVSPLIFKLAAPDGTVSSLPQPASHDTTLVMTAPTETREGTYVLSWRVVSLDGHPVGTISFSVGSASGRPAASLSNVASLPVRIAIWLVQFTLYVGLFFGAGASGYRALIAPLPIPREGSQSRFLFSASPPFRSPSACRASTRSTRHSAVSSCGRSGKRASARATARPLTAPPWRLWQALFALLLTPPRRASLLAGVAFASLGLALAASGHAATASPQWLMRPAVFLHAVAIAFWLGALPPLAFTLRAGGVEAARSFTRFSKRIPYAIAPLVIAGMTLAVTQIGEPSALVSTAYGRVRLAKLALLVLLFGLAAWNRWGPDGARGSPRRRAAPPSRPRDLCRDRNRCGDPRRRRPVALHAAAARARRLKRRVGRSASAWRGGDGAARDDTRPCRACVRLDRAMDRRGPAASGEGGDARPLPPQFGDRADLARSRKEWRRRLARRRSRAPACRRMDRACRNPGHRF